MSSKTIRIMRRFVAIGVIAGWLLILLGGFVKAVGGNYLPLIWVGGVLAFPITLTFLALLVVSLFIYFLCWLFELKQEQFSITPNFRERMKQVLGFDWLEGAFVCIGTITHCQVKKCKKKTLFEVTAKVLPQNTDVNDYNYRDDHPDYYEDTFEIELDKKYSTEEEKLIQKYLVDMRCSFDAQRDGENNLLSVDVTPLLSPVCLIDILINRQLVGYRKW